MPLASLIVYYWLLAFLERKIPSFEDMLDAFSKK